MPPLSLALLLASLPFLLLFPDVIQVGGTFIRADYLALPMGAALLLHRLAYKEAAEPFAGYTAGALLLLVLYPAFTVFQYNWVPSGIPGVEDAIKYTLWPLKMVVWGFCIRELFVAHPDPAGMLYRFMATLVVLVLGIQVLELTIPAVRGLLLQWYPIAAADRVSAITYRARGVFNGYDTTSMFYLLAVIVLTQLRASLTKAQAPHLLLLFGCLIGAFVAARTGTLLILGYLAFFYWARLPGAWRMLLVVAGITAGLGLSLASPQVLSGEEGSLGGRYLEIALVFTSGDALAVNSFWGTFAMNALALSDSSLDIWVGSGLTPATTADQLYVKYLVMFGIIGLSIWALIHVCLLIGLYRKAGLGTQVALRRAGFWFSFLVVIAHIKGGNYFFAQRLGELLTLVLLLAFTQSRLLRGSNE